MKKFLFAAAAVMSFAAPLALAPAAEAHPRGHHDSYDRDYDNRDDRRDERRAYREGYREGRHDDYRGRWDGRRHNGYYLGNSWYYGPPPQAYYSRHDYRSDYRQWRRGERLPAYYRERCRPVDYRYHRLSAPPRGYHWVESDRGEYLLVGIATGVILGLALAH